MGKDGIRFTLDVSVVAAEAGKGAKGVEAVWSASWILLERVDLGFLRQVKK